MAKNSANFSGSVKKNQEKISVYSKQLESSEKQLVDYSSQIDTYKVKIKNKEEEILQLQEKKEKLTEKEKNDLKTLQDIKKNDEKILKDNEKAYARTSASIEKIKSKLGELEKVNQNILESTSEYDSTLRSIGSHYGEINSVYKESEKILEQSKNEIAGIISITGLLNSSNKDLVDGILKAQSGYRGITNEVVKNIGTLEDSESAFKKISYQIEDQKKLISGLSTELDKIDTSDATQLELAKDLKIQLNAQVDALGKMKNAAAGVSKEMQNLKFTADKISGTMLGGWIDQFLNITKILGITDFGSIGEIFESIGKSDAQKTLKNLQDVSESVAQTNVPAPTAAEQPTPTMQMPESINANISTEGLEKQQTVAAEKNSNMLSRLNSITQKQSKKPAKVVQFDKKETKEPEVKIPPPDQTSIDNSKQITNVTNTTSVGETATPSIESGTKPLQDVGSIAQVQTEVDSTQKETEKAEVKDREFQKQETDVAGKTGNLIEKTAESAKGIPIFGEAIAGVAAAGVAAAALANEMQKFEDSLGAVTALYTAFTFTKEGFEELTQSVITGNGKIAESFKQSVRDTKEYRELQFDFTIGADVKERQNLESDYFNYSKGVFFDYYNYQNEVVKQNLDYELGLRRDALNFQFQQQSANLDAELEKRKTLAGSALKFIKDYSKISERALNAIGSSTKAIMDGMKKFGAVLETTPKELFSLLENAQGLAYSLGASADEVMNVGHLFKLTSNTSEEVGQRLVEGLKKVEGQNATSVFNEIAEASADIYRLMSATPNEIYKQTAALQKAGVKLTTMLKASDTMVLNYKDSIKAEMSLGAMMGRNISFNEARARLMSNDMAGAANAIRQQLAGIDVNQLNPFMKQELASATGLSMDQILEITQGKEIKTDEQKQLEQAEKTGEAIARGVLRQDIANQGAKLALEQAQRKQMLELEQSQRLVTLRLEQKQRLEQIPVEAAYRFYWDKVYSKKFAEENMNMGVLKDILTDISTAGGIGTGGALKTGGRDLLNELETQQFGVGGVGGDVMQNLRTMGINYQTTPGGQISIPNIQGGQLQTQNIQGGQFSPGIGQLNPQLQVLGSTIIELDNKVNQMGIRSTDPRYSEWLLGSHDIANKYKGGKNPEKATQEYIEFFVKTFGEQATSIQISDFSNERQSISIQKSNIDRQVDIAKHIAKDQYKNPRAYMKYKQDFNVSDEEEKKANELVSRISRGKGRGSETQLNEKAVNELYLNLNKMETSLAIKQQELLKSQIVLLDAQLKQGVITREQYNSKMEELKNSFPSSINVNVTKDGDKPTTGDTNRIPGGGYNPPVVTKDNFKDYMWGGPFGAGVGITTGFGMGGTQTVTGGTNNGSAQGPTGNTTPAFVTGFNTYTPSQPDVTASNTSTTSTETTNTSNVESILTIISENIAAIKTLIETPSATGDNKEVVTILNRIQSEANTRGILMYTKQIDQNGNLQRIVTRTETTAAQTQAANTNITYIKDNTVVPIKASTTLQEEMLVLLDQQTKILALISDNTTPTGKTPVINLDGAKISKNIVDRAAIDKTFNASNRVSYAR